jgi:hypothetical protein
VEGYIHIRRKRWKDSRRGGRKNVGRDEGKIEEGIGRRTEKKIEKELGGYMCSGRREGEI